MSELILVDGRSPYLLQATPWKKGKRKKKKKKRVRREGSSSAVEPQPGPSLHRASHQGPLVGQGIVADDDVVVNDGGAVEQRLQLLFRARLRRHPHVTFWRRGYWHLARVR